MNTAEVTARNSYIFDQRWAAEKQRLDALSSIYDAGTIEHLLRLGFSRGWHSWEVGAGTGTIARWLSTQAGEEGRVLATDIDTRFLDGMHGGNLAVRVHDVVTERLEDELFDLVHARALLEHLPERDKALENIVRTLKPGGWLLAEDIIQPPAVCDPDRHIPLVSKTLGAIRTAFRSLGADPDYGLRLPQALADAGLTDVGSNARVMLVTSGSREAGFLWLTLEHVGEKLVATGLLTSDEVAKAIHILKTPGTSFVGLIMVAAWGKRRNVVTTEADGAVSGSAPTGRRS